MIYAETEEQVVYLIMTSITYLSEEVLWRSPRQEVFSQFLLEVFMDHHTQRTLTWTSACIKTCQRQLEPMRVIQRSSEPHWRLDPLGSVHRTYEPCWRNRVSADHLGVHRTCRLQLLHHDLS